MSRIFMKPIVSMLVLVMLISLACKAADTTATPAPLKPTQESAPNQSLATEPVQKPATTAPVQETQKTSGGGAASLKDAQKAVIQIEAEGTFIDPQVGLVLNGAGRGSGFIFDPSGLAVTNNHVVTGAGLLKVWIGGDNTKTYNARVLGVSECSDLAVIKIEGSDFPYLEWHPGSADVGTDIYVAGFPLGEPEYSLNRGIISKSKADGKTSRSSIQNVVEYDATTNPGNSGGPVLDAGGKVMAVHFGSIKDAHQAFGIAGDLAQTVIATLKTGKNLESLGINGQAVKSDDGKLSGVWVASVQSGSPADKAGLQAGDILTKMENLVLASDGTMAEYCDILRSHDPTSTLNLQVLRWSDKQILEGQINGRQLAVTTTLSDNSSSSSGNSGNSSSSGSSNNEGIQGNPNASNSGDYFFKTEFDNADNWYSFAVPKTDNYTARTDNGALYIEVKDVKSTVYALYKLDIVPSDVRVDASVETVAGPNKNNISLICRATNDGWYEFSMNSGGYWYIYKYDYKDYKVLAQGASNAINLQKAKNDLAATCIGNQLTFYVNTIQLGQATDRSFAGGGQAGVSASSFDIAGVGVDFDWFTASVP